VTVTEKQIIN